jgi:hypothetical protein
MEIIVSFSTVAVPLQWKHNIQLKFKHMIRSLLQTFCRNVTTLSIQQLASTKVSRVDVAVSALDRSFAKELKKLHHSMDHEQWISLRPHIFYHLTALQQKRQNFNHFMIVMERLFDIHHFERPYAPLAILQEVNAEFDVYQAKLGRYINGSINTTKEWGKEFRESIEYMFWNSGTQPVSVINDAAKWLIGPGQKETMPDYNVGGTLVLLNVFVVKWYQRKLNWRWPWFLIAVIILIHIIL